MNKEIKEYLEREFPEIKGYFESEFPGYLIKEGDRKGAALEIVINGAGKLYKVKVSYIFISQHKDLKAKLSELKVAAALKKSQNSTVTVDSDGVKLD